MNKSKVILILCLTFFLFGKTVYAQKVSNITYRQEQSNIIVSYDLETKTPCKVSLYVSTNGGNTWQGPLTKITGDVGYKITSGGHNITWNVLEEFEELRGDKIMFQVRAVGDNIDTVIIGAQEWTTKNLDVSNYRNGDIIPEVKDPNKWAKLTTGAWCYYNNQTKNGAIYGKLYNWYAVNDTRGLAPEGFHIPSDDEWSTLTTYLGGESIAGGKMKVLNMSTWKMPNKNANNSSGFLSFPGGYRNQEGTFYGIDEESDWWSSTEVSLELAWTRYLYYLFGTAFKFKYNKLDGISVRCIRD
jgi:uncharacterized protein (TIGR02145 family)